MAAPQKISDARVLRAVLERGNERTCAAIAEELGVSVQAARYRVRVLEKAGFVERASYVVTRLGRTVMEADEPAYHEPGVAK